MLSCLTSEKRSDEESTLSRCFTENIPAAFGDAPQIPAAAVERNEDRISGRWLPSSAPSLHVELYEEFADIRETSLIISMEGKAATGSACYSG